MEKKKKKKKKAYPLLSSDAGTKVFFYIKPTYFAGERFLLVVSVELKAPVLPTALEAFGTINPWSNGNHPSASAIL